MRAVTLACLLVATTASADGLVVQKKVTELETTDKVTKMDLIVRVPDVLSCFDRARTVIVTLTAKDGALTSTSDAKDKATASCLQKQFATMKVKGTFKASVQLVVKPDRR